MANRIGQQVDHNGTLPHSVPIMATCRPVGTNAFHLRVDWIRGSGIAKEIVIRLTDGVELVLPMRNPAVCARGLSRRQSFLLAKTDNRAHPIHYDVTAQELDLLKAAHGRKEIEIAIRGSVESDADVKCAVWCKAPTTADIASISIQAH